ncbi:MAG TPA: hypothetical protein VEW05_18680 [Candidatus Polarisedimenticolia bacterium]|nr:hypothetical protein [Candidatus Polarisedimenticolia bacterium]
MQITQQDYEVYARVYAGRIFDGSQVLLHTAELLADGSIVGPHAYEAKACPECFSTCTHGEQLTPEEIDAAKASGKKLSSECPVCIGSTDPDAWNQFLNSIGFSAYRGMAPAMHYVPTREGGIRAIGERKTVAKGGSAQIEEVDAQSPVARDDMQARSKPRAKTESDEKE